MVEYLKTHQRQLLTISLVTLLVYANSLINGFVWDDEEQILNNPHLRSWSSFPLLLGGATFSTGGAGLSGWFFRPLLSLNYFFHYQLFGAHPFFYHLTQVLAHLATVILFYYLANRLIKSKNHLPALIAALFFAVHPGINEAISYIAASSEIYLTAFILLTLILLQKYKKLTPTSFSLLLFTSLSAPLYKETGLLVLPLSIAFVLLYQLPRILLAPVVSSTAAYTVLRFLIFRVTLRHPEFSPISEAPFFHRLLTVPAILTDYLRLTFFPLRLGVSQHYVVTGVGESRFIFSLILVLITLTLFLYFTFKTKKILLVFALFWLIFTLGLISNLFPLDMTIAERWLYLPFIGVSLILTQLLTDLRLKTIKQPIVGLIVIYLSLLGLRTVLRNSDWRNGLSLYRHDIQQNINSFDLENNYGVELFRVGEYQQAKTHFENSIRLQPKWYFAYNNLGAVLNRQGDATGAGEMYQETLKRSDYYLSYENLAGLYLSTGQASAAAEIITTGLSKLPRNPRLWLYRSVLLMDTDIQEAIKSCLISYKLAPLQPTAQLCQDLYTKSSSKQN